MDDIDVKRLRLRPGDIVVATYDGHLSCEMGERLRALFTSALPDGTKAILIDSSVSLSVLTKAELETLALAAA